MWHFFWGGSRPAYIQKSRPLLIHSLFYSHSPSLAFISSLTMKPKESDKGRKNKEGKERKRWEEMREEREKKERTKRKDRVPLSSVSVLSLPRTWYKQTNWVREMELYVSVPKEVKPKQRKRERVSECIKLENQLICTSTLLPGTQH